MQTLGIGSCVFIAMASWHVDTSGRSGTISCVTRRCCTPPESRQVWFTEGSEPEVRMQGLMQDSGGGAGARGRLGGGKGGAEKLCHMD